MIDVKIEGNNGNTVQFFKGLLKGVRKDKGEEVPPPPPPSPREETAKEEKDKTPKERQKELDEELSVASFKGDIEGVKNLIERGANVNAKSEETGWSSLMSAVSENHKDVAELLLANGADVNAKDNHGFTALMIAAVDRRKNIIKLLLVNGADLNARDKEGFTAITYAATKGYDDIVELIRGTRYT
jgi:ankyrin repeat protein